MTGTPKLEIPESASSNETAQSTLLTPDFLLSVCASVLYWSWLFLFYWSDSLTGGLGLYGGVLVRGMGLTGSAVVLLAIYIICKHTGLVLRNPLLGIVAPAVFSPAAGGACLFGMLTGISIPFWVTCLCWFLSGMGVAFILVQLGELISPQTNEGNLLLTFTMVLLSCLVCLSILKMPTYFIWCAMLVMPWLGLGIARVGLRLRKDDACEVPNVVAGKPVFNSIKAKRDYRLLLMQQLVFSIIFSTGQLIGVVYAISNGEDIFSFFWIGLLFSGFLFIFYCTWLNQYLPVGQLQLILLALIALGIVFLAVPSTAQQPLMRYWCSVLLCFGFTSFDILSLSQLTRTVAVNKLPFSCYFAFGRFANALGMVIGWAIVFITIALAGGFDGGIQFQYAFCIVVVIAIFYLFYEIKSREGLNDDFDMSETIPMPASEVGYWRNGCESLRRRYGLSPREYDVFVLLGRGRDINYICDSLFISPSTVKTHSYHIYRKMNIHSQQELITAVEHEATAFRSVSRQH